MRSLEVVLCIAAFSCLVACEPAAPRVALRALCGRIERADRARRRRHAETVFGRAVWLQLHRHYIDSFEVNGHEQQFKTDRAALDGDLRAANAELSEARRIEDQSNTRV